MIYYLHTKSQNKKPLKLFHKAFSNNSTSYLFPKKYCLVIGNANFVGWSLENPQILQFMIQNNFFVNTTSDIERNQQSLLMMGRVLKHVLQPRPIVLAEMNRIMPNFNTTTYIGVHLRCGGKLSDMHDPFAYLSMTNLVTVFKHLQGISDSLPIFLSTDSKIAKVNMQKYLPTKTIYTDTQDVAIADSQLMAPSKALIYLLSTVSEIMLLGSSSQCYGTAGSTFSHVGCALAQKVPYVIGKRYESFVKIDSKYSYIYRCLL